jgi:hypothetical protein
MRTFSLLALLLLLLGPVLSAAAQGITVERLINLTATPEGHSANLPDWTFQPLTKQAAEEKLTWSCCLAYDSDTVHVPPLQLSLRPAPHGYDVLLYVKRLAVYNHLRRELEKQKLEPLPVTCLGTNCLGFRFNTPTCTVAFYEGKPGDYPFVIVVQPKAGRPPLPEPPALAGKHPLPVKVKSKAADTAEPASAQR